MTFIPVEYHGVHTTGPEQFACVVLRWAEQKRILPIWLSPLAAAELEIRDKGYSPRRPGSHELLAETLTRLTSGVSGINIVSHYEGVFIASIVLNDGQEIDARASDAVILARMFEMDIHVDEDVLLQASVFVSDEDLADYLQVQVKGATVTEGDSSASGDAQADKDFEEMMRSLGMSEEDLFGRGAGPGDGDGPGDSDDGSEDVDGDDRGSGDDGDSRD
ncbi:bifunctional nuclease family protein [Corynebacterium halotolerans]|uniref:BFN domain-containing protein n=1 Tax=Corynebacterium halotolerans YIM 70093 = DSM 44683 TaxID=1121362 RepID=M1P705_9CORY|nr:bifunctional nuclease family protein [Corynebacterium halotolerans]AGF72421.1 hypothetical protein A605_07095 [Corynebacterium halotolerans YIM 70093 = DSM 44683]